MRRCETTGVKSIKARNYIDDHKMLIIKVCIIVLIILAAFLIRAGRETNSSIEIYGKNTEDKDVLNELPESETMSQADNEEPEENSIYIDISGEVNTPGVYEVPPGARLYEVIEIAGGLTEDADIDAINQAVSLSDGEKIVIPEAGSGETFVISKSMEVSDDSGVIDINKADKDKLTTLPGIGDVIAQRIIDYRRIQPFESIDEIKNVKGIGDKVYEKIKDRITV